MRRVAVAITWLTLLSATSLVLGAPSSNDSDPGESKGQAELDAAISGKLSIESLDDINEVIAHIERALDLGLNAEATEFAKHLLASTLYQRAQVITSAIFAAPEPDPRWPVMRDAARRDARRAAELDPEQAMSHLLLVRLNALPGGDRAEMNRSLDRALELGKDNADIKYEALLLRAGLREKLEQRLSDFAEAHQLKPGEPAPLRARGALYMSQDKFEQALADFDAALAIDPDDAQTHEARGLALVMLKRVDDARGAFAKAAELAPKSITAWLQKAQLDFMSQNYADAVQSASKIIDLDEDNLAARLLRAQALGHLKNVDAAVADAQHILALKPKNGAALKVLALIYMLSNRPDDAVTELKRAVDDDPRDLELQLQLGMLYRQLKKLHEAIAVFDAALAIDPQHWALRYQRGDTLLSVGRHAEALADYNEAVKQAPRESGLLNNLAWLLATSPDEQVRDGKRAVELAKIACEATEYKQANLLSTLGAAYAETGDLQAAKKWAHKALEVADEAASETLKKELATYESGRPVREKLHEDQDATAKPPVNVVDEVKKSPPRR